MLQRVYGTAWEAPEQLDAYIKLKEEAARRDHRKLGQELNLFSIQETAGEASAPASRLVGGGAHGLRRLGRGETAGPGAPPVLELREVRKGWE